MIKHLNTSFAFLAMKRILANKSLAYSAKKLVRLGIKELSILFSIFVQFMNTVCGINFGDNIPHDYLYKRETTVKYE